MRTQNIKKKRIDKNSLVQKNTNSLESVRKSEETVKELAKENAIMAEIGRIISSTLDIQEVYERFAEKVSKFIPFDRILINTVNPKDNTTTLRYVAGIQTPDRRIGDAIPLAGSMAGEVIRRRASLSIQMKDREKLLGKFPSVLPSTQPGFQSLMSVPLISKDEVIGVLHLRSTKPNAYTERDLRLAESIGAQIAGAIANAQLFIELKKSEEALHTEKKRFQILSENAPFGIVMIEKDNTFKYINPKFKELFGYDLNDVPDGETWFRKAYPNPTYRHDVISAWIKDLKSFEPGEKIHRTFTVNCKDEMEKVVLFIPVLLETGEFLMTCEDITQRKQAEEESKRTAQENAIMAEIGRIISSSLNIDEVYERFTKEVAKLISFDRIVINIINIENETTGIAYAAGVDIPGRQIGFFVPLTGTATEECMRTRSSMLIQPEDTNECLARFPALLPTFQAGLRSIILTPLISKDQFIGALSLRSLKPNAYTDQDIKITERIANQIAGAIASTQLFSEHKKAEKALQKSEESAKRLAQENELVAEIGRVISSSLNIEEVYERFAEEVHKLIPFDRVAVNLINPDNQTFTVTYLSGVEIADRPAGQTTPLAGTLTGETVRTRSPLLIQGEDIKDLRNRFPGTSPIIQNKFRSMLSVPLLSKHQVIAVLNIRSTQPNAYTEREKRLAERVSNQIAGAIANAQLFTERKQAEEALRRSEETARRLAQENELVAEIGRIISSTLNIDEVYERFAEKVREIIAFDRLTVNIVNTNDNTRTTGYNSGIQIPDRQIGNVIPLAGSLSGEVAHTRSSRLINVEDIEELLRQYPGLSQSIRAGIRSSMSVPLISKDEVIGVLHLRSKKPNAYTEKDLRLAERVGDQIAGAIANAHLFKERIQAEEALRRSEEGAKKLVQENVVMAEIGRIISSSLNIDEVYERFTKEVAKLISFDRIVINAVDIEKGTTVTPYAAGINVPNRQIGISIPLAGTATEECFRTRSSMLIQPEDIDKCLARFPGLLPSFQTGLRSIILTPLISKDQFIGALSLRSLKPNAYTDQDIKITERIANQIAGAIASTQLFSEHKKAEEALQKSEESAKRLAQENAVMVEIGRIISSTLDIKEVYERFAEEVRKLIPFDRLTINTFNPKDNTCILQYDAGIKVPGRKIGDVIPLAGSISGEVIRTGSSLIIQEENRENLLRKFNYQVLSFKAGIRSMMSVSLISKGEAIGVLHFRSTQPNAYTEMYLRLAERVGNQIAGAIANAQLFIERKQAEESLKRSEEEAKRLAQENELVAEIGRVISSTLDIEEVYEQFSKEVAKLIPIDRITINFINSKNNTVTNAYVAGAELSHRTKGGSYSLAGTLTEEMMRTRTSVLIHEENYKECLDRFPGFALSLQAGFRSLIVVPLISKDEVIGALQLRSTQPNAYTEIHLRIAERVSNQIAGAIANAQLFMEHKKSEEALSRLATIVQESVDAIFTIDNQDRITFWNQGAKLLFGYQPDEILGQPVNLLIPPERQEERKKIRALLSKEKFIRNYETERLAKGGQLVPVNITLMEMCDEKGELISRSGILRDISETKKLALEKETHYQELKIIHEISQAIISSLDLKSILEVILDKAISLGPFDLGAIRLLDPTGEILEPVVYRGYRNPKENVKSHIIKDPSSGKILLRVITYKEPKIEENVPEYAGMRTLKAEGIQSAIVIPIRDQEKSLGVLLLGSRTPRKFQPNEVRLLNAIGNQLGTAVQKARLYEEIRHAYEHLKTTHEQMLKAKEALRESEEQLRQSQKIEAIGQLAGGIAHDFNNLMTVIKGYSQLAFLKLKEGDPLKGNMEEIQRAADRAANLTHQLLAFSRRQILEFKVLDLNTIFRDLDKMLRRLIGEDIELIYLLSDDLWKIKTDPGQIEQVILNLAVNARDAMPSGGKLVIETGNVYLDETYTRTHITTKPGYYVVFTMSDAGCGMPPEIQEHIFEPFFTTKEVGKGTGLGLSTVYGIVKQSDGDIWVYSEPGKGTTFKIYLPRVEKEVRPLPQQDDNAPISRGKETVLLVEDEGPVRRLAVQVLRENGYNLLEAGNGEEALRMVQEQADNKIDLLLTDVVMPRMGGKELADRLKTLRPEIKVLFTSGYTDNTIVHHGVLESGTNFLQKPFTPSVLLSKVREVLDK